MSKSFVCLITPVKTQLFIPTLDNFCLIVPKPKISWQQNCTHLRFKGVSSIIEDLIARKVFNNRGEETIEVDVITTGGFGRAAAPAGKSRGKAEVAYYPQGGVEAAIKKVDDLIAPELAGLNADFQEEIDSTLHEVDGSTDLKNIGGNTGVRDFIGQR